jgi:predicted DsbA family dithiol-disulfide isomerase/uncharacterized membrane protein
MNQSLTMGEGRWPRMLSLVAGLGMAVASAMTIQHFFAANYPESIWAGSFCDISAFFNCDSSAFATISQIGGVPIGFFGLMVGGLVALGALFPSAALERTNKTIALLNIVGVVALVLYSVFYLGSLCLLCTGFYLFSGLSFYLFWRYGIDRAEEGLLRRHFRLSVKIAATFGVVTLVGAYGMALFHDAKKDAQSGGVASRIVEEYYGLPTVEDPSFLSPYWTIRSTEAFEDAPIRIVSYVDFLCPDCLYLAQQMDRLEGEFDGKINVAFQFFPLEGSCNDVVDKDLHPGACDLSHIAAHDPEVFNQIHDEIFGNFRQARDPQWRADLARRYGVEDALEDADTKALVQRIIQTGAEYEKTSDRYAHGIRSTPTMIINNRLVIGTFPDEQLRAIFHALVVEHESGEKPKFMENWARR